MKIFDKQRIVRYIEKRHLEDGGYFFARVLPSSGSDTCFAVKTLKLLNYQPSRPKKIIDYWQRESIDTIYGLYFAVETFKDLGVDTKKINKYSRLLKDFEKCYLSENSKNVVNTKSLETAQLCTDLADSELTSLFYWLSLCVDLEISFNKRMVIKKIIEIRNEDGGYGKIKKSQIASMFYALKIFKLLDHDIYKKESISYLDQEWNKIHYLEDFYWWTESMEMLGQTVDKYKKMKLSKLVELCQKDNGGFSRSQFMGIATIEDTFYAVSILRRLGLI